MDLRVARPDQTQALRWYGRLAALQRENQVLRTAVSFHPRASSLVPTKNPIGVLFWTPASGNYLNGYLINQKSANCSGATSAPRLSVLVAFCRLGEGLASLQMQGCVRSSKPALWLG